MSGGKIMIYTSGASAWQHYKLSLSDNVFPTFPFWFVQVKKNGQRKINEGTYTGFCGTNEEVG